MLHTLYEGVPWWRSDDRNTNFAKQALHLRSIRAVQESALRNYLQWYRLTYTVYRVRRLRRILAHGFAYLRRWKTLKWGNTRRPIAARRDGGQGVEAAEVDLEAADPVWDPADVIDAAGENAAGTLMRAWWSLTGLCLGTLASRFVPLLYFIMMMSWGVLKAAISYILHVLIVGLLETTYVRRMVLTFFAALAFKLAYWLGLLPHALDSAGGLISNGSTLFLP